MPLVHVSGKVQMGVKDVIENMIMDLHVSNSTGVLFDCWPWE